MHWPIIIVLITFLIHTSHQRSCCTGSQNKLNGTRCIENSTFIKLPCDDMYMLNPNEDDSDSFSEINGVLVHNNISIHSPNYCTTYSNNEKQMVAIVCVEYTINNSPESYLLKASLILISVFFLTLTLIVYILIPRLQDLQGKCTIAAVGALIFGYIMLAMLQFGAVFVGELCKVAGYFMYISLMTAFFWLNIMSFNIWRTTVKPNWFGTEKQWFYVYSAYGFITPFMLMVFTIVTDHIEGDHLKPNIGKGSCWFSGKYESWAYFYSPIFIIVVLNTIFFVWTSVHLYKQNFHSTPQQLKILRFKFWLYLKLFIIMGITWIFELLSSVFSDIHLALDYFWAITDFVNALQGLLIFIILVALRKKVLRDLAKRKMCNIPFPKSWETLENDEEFEDEEENKLSNAPQAMATHSC